jgi:hypothetical protein
MKNSNHSLLLDEAIARLESECATKKTELLDNLALLEESYRPHNLLREAVTGLFRDEQKSRPVYATVLSALTEGAVGALVKKYAPSGGTENLFARLFNSEKSRAGE